jgi:secreted Zn-dependent insulinase-like peptidase
MSYPPCEFPILKSKNDKKEYRHISLENGIRVLLISNKHDIRGSNISPKKEKTSNSDQEQLSSSSDEENTSEFQDSVTDWDLEADQKSKDKITLSHHDKSLKEKLMKTPGIAGFALQINSGCANEDKEIHGLAHLLEHVNK